jgi:predicted ATP-grasp superfamily ATP-dependent carboligase
VTRPAATDIALATAATRVRAYDPLPGVIELPLVIVRQLGRRLSELMGTSAAS